MKSEIVDTLLDTDRPIKKRMSDVWGLDEVNQVKCRRSETIDEFLYTFDVIVSIDAELIGVSLNRQEGDQ